MSNDKWYGESMPAQHLQHAKARAVESNKWVVRATLDGISPVSYTHLTLPTMIRV